jgi:hypothetical protein
MEYVDRQWKERIFSEVAGTNMTKIGKVFADVRDQLVFLIWTIMDSGGCCILFVTRSALRWLVGSLTFFIFSRLLVMRRALGLLSVICIHFHYPQSVMLLMA